MQIVGKSCARCEERIGIVREAEGCFGCQAAYHKACLDGSDVCPGCGTDMATERLRAAARARQEEREGYRRGRQLVRLVVGIMLAVTVATAGMEIAARVAQEAGATPPVAPVRLLLTGALLYFLYRGHPWAKALTITLCILSAPVALLVALAFHEVAPLMALSVAGASTVYVACAALLLLSRSAGSFLYFQRHPDALAERLGEGGVA